MPLPLRRGSNCLTPGSNILITKCDPRNYYASEPGFHASPVKNGLRAKLAVEYQNQAPTPVTGIDFGLVSGGRVVASGEDTGAFAAGATIDHDVWLYQDVFPLQAQTYCVVLHVRYANGTAWHNPNPPPPKV